jgi:hypothetical protein
MFAQLNQLNPFHTIWHAGQSDPSIGNKKQNHTGSGLDDLPRLLCKDV